MDDADKLHHLLEHWCEHNASHREEFERWAGRARNAGLPAVAAAIGDAGRALDEATACLQRAREQLRGGA